MNEFPSDLEVKNKDLFPQKYYNHVLCSLRKRIYEHIIKEDENNYFDFEKFMKTKKLSSLDNEKALKTIIEELESLGWKCKLSYGDTGLFIYSTEQPPKSCW